MILIAKLVAPAIVLLAAGATIYLAYAIGVAIFG